MRLALGISVHTSHHITHHTPQIWDLGGQQNLRPFWATYYKKSDAVIMVVDSTDRARIGVCKVSTAMSRDPFTMPVV